MDSSLLDRNAMEITNSTAINTMDMGMGMGKMKISFIIYYF